MKKDDVIECMKAISAIDGAVRYISGGLKEDSFIYGKIDLIIEKLMEELNHADRKEISPTP